MSTRHRTPAEAREWEGDAPWRRESGIFVVVPIEGEAGESIRELQRRFDPKLAAALPPHITIIGSSGAGPIAPHTSLERLRDALEPVVSATAPFTLHFGVPTRFMQTEIVVLPLEPYGPLRDLHERILATGLPFARPRFAFTPHATLNFYRTLTPETRRALLASRVTEPVAVDRIEISLTNDPQPPKKLAELALTGR